MAYIPKTLVMGRCVRCGKKLYRNDVVYRCINCDIFYCPTCVKKTFNRCQICLSELETI